MMTKKQAIEIADAVKPDRIPGGYIAQVLDELDRAGAFPSEATLAEIADVARRILESASRMGSAFGPSAEESEGLALRLASACRAAGLVK